MHAGKNEAALSPERKKAADASILHSGGCGKQGELFRKLSTLSTTLPTGTGKLDGKLVENCGFCGKILWKTRGKARGERCRKTGRMQGLSRELAFFPESARNVTKGAAAPELPKEKPS